MGLGSLRSGRESRALSLSLSLLPMRMQREGSYLHARMRAFIRKYIGWHLDLVCPTLQALRNKCLFFKPPTLCCLSW